MQRVTATLLTLFLIFFLMACKKNDSVSSGQHQPTPVGVPTPVGAPIDDEPTQKTIGAEGGTLTSRDGRITINIPSGALASSETVSIQPITNFNPLAIGNAYRLEPHDIEFKKPVTIEFNYRHDELKNTIPELLGVAYQDSSDIWQARGGAVLAKNSSSIKVTTNHFSDWSLFESFSLASAQTAVSVNGSVEMEVFTTADLFVPLAAEQEVPMGKKVSLSAKFIKEWKLAGAGNLQANGPNATYKAPSEVPVQNPVTVSVSIDIPKRGTCLLVKQIEIVDDNGEIEIKVADGPWIKKVASPAVQMEEGLYVIGDADGDTQGSYVMIMWEGEEGTHHFKRHDETKGTHVHYLVTNANDYVPYYAIGEDEVETSGGGVTIESMGEEDGFIKGTFSIKPAGYGLDLRNTINIEGKFRVKKGW